MEQTMLTMRAFVIYPVLAVMFTSAGPLDLSPAAAQTAAPSDVRPHTTDASSGLTVRQRNWRDATPE